MWRAHDGSNETALTSGDVLFPACSPDGQFAYYLNGVHPEKIRKISVVDGSISEIADVLGDTLFGNIVVSPDGKYLAYPYQQYSPPVVELAVIPSGGGTAINKFQVPGFLGTLRWCGSRILRGGGCRFWLGDAGKSIASGSSAVEQGAGKAKPPVRGGFTWFHVRTRGPYQLHLYGDRFRECETKD